MLIVTRAKEHDEEATKMHDLNLQGEKEADKKS